MKDKADLVDYTNNNGIIPQKDFNEKVYKINQKEMIDINWQ